MDIEFDPVKSQKNIEKHGISLAEAVNFEHLMSYTVVDSRKDYGETRYVALGYIYDRLHVLCYVLTKTGMRIISLRKANLRERKKYEKEKLH